VAKWLDSGDDLLPFWKVIAEERKRAGWSVGARRRVIICAAHKQECGRGKCKCGCAHKQAHTPFATFNLFNGLGVNFGQGCASAELPLSLAAETRRTCQGARTVAFSGCTDRVCGGDVDVTERARRRVPSRRADCLSLLHGRCDGQTGFGWVSR
jgi:hypothetical protein